MNQIVSNLLVYGQLPEDSILWQLSDICEKLKNGSESKDALRTRVFGQVKNLLTLATEFAFDKNLWHNYLTFLLITNENPFSLVCEKMGAQEGTVNCFVKHDFEVFMKLFDYDFSWIEKELSVDCFTHLTHYQAIRKKVREVEKTTPEFVENSLYVKHREEIMEKAVATGIGIVSPARIDEINILQATYEAMRQAIANLSVQPDVLLNDAVNIPQVNIKQVPIIKGDAKSISIGAASIIAKVTRDRLMADYAQVFPEYDFAGNKGYGSASHIEALKKYGPTPIHRKSFIKNFL